MLAPLRDTRADYSLMLEKYGSMNFFPCQAKSGQSGPNRTWQALSGICAGAPVRLWARSAWVQAPQNSSAAAAMATRPTPIRGALFPRPVMAHPPVSSAPAEVLL